MLLTCGLKKGYSLHMKLCALCREPMGPGYPNRKYCSALCRDKLLPRKCDQCGAIFRPSKPKPSSLPTWGRFCSTACAYHWAWTAKLLARPVTKLCCFCHKEMKDVHPNRYFCSIQCRNRPLKALCQECKKTFISIQPSGTRTRTRFCSRSCKWKWVNRQTGYHHLNATHEEQIVANMFPNAVLHHEVKTGTKTKKNKIHSYELDVAFPNLKLAVEIDGGVHRIEAKKQKDLERTQKLESLGWTVLRFSNRQVTRDLTAVKALIQSTISRLTDIQAIP